VENRENKPYPKRQRVRSTHRERAIVLRNGSSTPRRVIFNVNWSDARSIDARTSAWLPGRLISEKTGRGAGKDAQTYRCAVKSEIVYLTVAAIFSQ